MIYIKKEKEPRKLIQYKKQKFASFKDMPLDIKEEVRDKLLNEQGFLCCYCMRRINNDNTKIEHWDPQSCNPQAQLDYKNMLAACNGHEGPKIENQTCDTRKGDSKISITPLNKQAMSTIYYKGNGIIGSQDERYNEDINLRLNLNHGNIVSARREAINAVIEYMSKTCLSGGTWSKAKIQGCIDKWSTRNNKGEFEVCNGAVLYYLEKRKKRAL